MPPRIIFRAWRGNLGCPYARSLPSVCDYAESSKAEGTRPDLFGRRASPGIALPSGWLRPVKVACRKPDKRRKGNRRVPRENAAISGACALARDLRSHPATDPDSEG